jgi:hypothetical protein
MCPQRSLDAFVLDDQVSRNLPFDKESIMAFRFLPFLFVVVFLSLLDGRFPARL